MTTQRTEKDMLGEKALPADALYGIHAARAKENFNLSGRTVHPRLTRAYGMVKLAAVQVNHDLDPWDEAVFDAICAACCEVMDGDLEDAMVTDALQGGAGTATNMNINEVIANRALVLLGRTPGEYGVIDPIDDINKHQSTNDTYPTALKVAAIHGLRELETALVSLVESCQHKETEFAAIVKVGRTQLQDAVLTTMGRTMSTFAEAFGRDRWRVFKCQERLRVVNLGGTAIGTGLGAPRQYIFRVVDTLRELSGIGLARAENLVECTQNADAFVEAAGMLNACAANLTKTAQDLRLMSSGPSAGLGELHLPAIQAGSSIMPGKVNPVVPEAVIQGALTVMADHGVVTQCAAMGNLELNAFLPLLADRLLTAIDVLTRSVDLLRVRCIDGLEADESVCRRHVDGATATVTALVDRIGYHAAQKIAARAAETGLSVRDVAISDGPLTADEFDRLISAEAVMCLGRREEAK